MVLTFLAAVATLFAGIFDMGKNVQSPTKNKTNRLMVLRVTICLVLLVEMVIYATFLR